MYNDAETRRIGRSKIAPGGLLRDLHDKLDHAYGWPCPMETKEILARLAALHNERVEEKERVVVRWLRPNYTGARRPLPYSRGHRTAGAAR